MNVKDIMTRPLQTCTLHDNLATVAMRMWESDCGALPVKNHDGQVIGMITDRDICMAAATKHREISDAWYGRPSRATSSRPIPKTRSQWRSTPWPEARYAACRWSMMTACSKVFSP